MPNRDADADAPAASVTLREREGGPVSATTGWPERGASCRAVGLRPEEG